MMNKIWSQLSQTRGVTDVEIKVKDIGPAWRQALRRWEKTGDSNCLEMVEKSVCRT